MSAAILVVLFRQTTLAQLEALAREARPELVAAALGVYALISAIRALRVRLLFRGPFGDLLAITVVHQLLLRILPARTGELGFGWLLRRTGRAGFTRGMTGLALLRALDLATVLAIGGVALVTTRAGDSIGNPALVAAGLGVAALALGLGMRGMIRLGARAAGATARALRIDDRPRVGRALDALRDATAWSDGLSLGTLGLVGVVTMAQWCASFLLVWVLGHAMGLAPSAADAVVAGTGTVFGSTVPVPGVGTFGPLEAGWAGGFVLTGVPLERAVASGLGFSLFTFGYSVLTAAAGWAWLEARRPGEAPSEAAPEAPGLD